MRAEIASTLEAAVAGLQADDLCEALQAVAEELPVALAADFANVRVLGTDHRLHLVAAAGCTAIEIRKRAFQPLAVAWVREMLANGGHERVALSLGIQWMEVAWIAHDGAEIGTIALGARTKRRPGDAELRTFRALADRLGPLLSGLDRRPATLRACSLRLARRWTMFEWPADGRIARLRPRERAILELYADGLSTGDIAALLVISPHTVRTHVKLAMRRLGVHARDEAAAMVRLDQVAQLV